MDRTACKINARSIREKRRILKRNRDKDEMKPRESNLRGFQVQISPLPPGIANTNATSLFSGPEVIRQSLEKATSKDFIRSKLNSSTQSWKVSIIMVPAYLYIHLVIYLVLNKLEACALGRSYSVSVKFMLMPANISFSQCEPTSTQKVHPRRKQESASFFFTVCNLLEGRNAESNTTSSLDILVDLNREAADVDQGCRENFRY